ncbi:MAG TPA: TorF family putative porin [Gammaproteobacteria bacterium]|nr:TorF family putative porin [Gammaproteobacteria bacterium]
MKKAFIILSLGIISSLALSAQAATCCKKQHKKWRSCCVKRESCCIKQVQPQEMTLAAQPASMNSDNDFDFFKQVSGSMALTTNYVFRGISQTTNLPAIQGGLTYTFPIGIYLNLWGSNVKFANRNASIELDTIVGIHKTAGESFTYDINLARYNYPSVSALAYNEMNTVFNYRFFQLGISYSSNVYNAHKAGTYINGGINYQIPQEFAFNLENINIIALLGRYKLGGAAGSSYTDYNIALNKKLSDIYSIGFQWTTTNGQAQNRPYDRDLFIGTASASF